MRLQPGFDKSDLPKLGMAFGCQRVFRVRKKFVDINMVEQVALSSAVVTISNSPLIRPTICETEFAV